jgi:hypothetical protein
MIIKNSYFKGEIYLPHAKPGATDAVIGVEANVNDFINEYVRDCLIKCLGVKLALEFIAELNPLEANGLKDTADAKWNLLLNGNPSYTDPNDSQETLVWKGIRYKSFSGGEYDKSFLAYYVYYFEEKNANVTRGDTGNQQTKTKNAERSFTGEKPVNAWNKFLTWVQGSGVTPKIYHSFDTVVGVDYLNTSEEVCLYKYINDTNSNTPDTFLNFQPKAWGVEINTFGI